MQRRPLCHAQPLLNLDDHATSRSTDLSPESTQSQLEELIMNEVDRTIDQANKIKRAGTIGCIVLAGGSIAVAIFAALTGFSGAADDQREAAAPPATSELSGSAAPEDDLHRRRSLSLSPSVLILKSPRLRLSPMVPRIQTARSFAGYTTAAFK